MILQDKNSKLAGVAFFRERVIYKASAYFVNPKWDLVDAYAADTSIINRVDIPLGSNGTLATGSDLKKLVLGKQQTRESYKEVIKLRYDMIKKYLGVNKGDTDMNLAVKAIVDKEGRRKGFVFKVPAEQR
jgi:hypothetical protein